MRIDLMRTIDRWVGVPICFVLSIINLFVNLFSRQNNAQPKRILLIKLSEMGAIITSYPLMKELKRNYPEAEIHFLTFSENKNILKHLNFVDLNNVLSINNKTFLKFAIDTIMVSAQILKNNYDVVIDLEFFSRFTSILTFQTLRAKKIGFYKYKFEGLYRGNIYTHNIQYNQQLHVSQNYLNMISSIKDDNQNTPESSYQTENLYDIEMPQFYPDTKMIEKCNGLLEEIHSNLNSSLIIVNSGNNLIPLREWPIENFVRLINLITANFPEKIFVFLGTESCKTKSDTIINYLKSVKCINLCGKTSIEDLLTFLSHGEMLISNDSGIAHIASLTKIKQHIFFGPETPHVFKPLTKYINLYYKKLACSPCFSAFNHRNTNCKNNRCLQAINPQEVFDLILNELKEL